MKKIRKTYSGVVPNGKVLNSRNDSQQDTYSSDYLNRNIPNTNDLGEIIVDDVVCKNVLNKELLMNESNYTESLNDNYKGFKLNLKPNTTYTLGCYYYSYVMDGAWECRLFDANKNLVEGIQSSHITKDTVIRTFTTDSTGVMYIGILYGKTERLINFFSAIDIQIEEGRTATTPINHKDFGIVSANEKASFMKLAPVERLVNPDLNNLEGNYMTYCLNAVNVPGSASVVYGFLIQLHIPGQNFKKQLWTSYNEDVWFKRSLVDNNWSAWKEL